MKMEDYNGLLLETIAMFKNEVTERDMAHRHKSMDPSTTDY
jgi:hypothetical protein